MIAASAVRGQLVQSGSRFNFNFLFHAMHTVVVSVFRA